MPEEFVGVMPAGDAGADGNPDFSAGAAAFDAVVDGKPIPVAQPPAAVPGKEGDDAATGKPGKPGKAEKPAAGDAAPGEEEGELGEDGLPLDPIARAEAMGRKLAGGDEAEAAAREKAEQERIAAEEEAARQAKKVDPATAVTAALDKLHKANPKLAQFAADFPEYAEYQRETMAAMLAELGGIPDTKAEFDARYGKDVAEPLAAKLQELDATKAELQEAIAEVKRERIQNEFRRVRPTFDDDSKSPEFQKFYGKASKAIQALGNAGGVDGAKALFAAFDASPEGKAYAARVANVRRTRTQGARGATGSGSAGGRAASQDVDAEAMSFEERSALFDRVAGG